MNHQDIADRIAALGVEKSAAHQREQERMHRERESLRDACGELGHIFVKTSLILSVYDPSKVPRECAVCGTFEKSGA